MPNLADKYRPTTFSEVKGNDDLKSIIERTLKKADKPQTYILQGERGCGKTTLARIMAAELGATGRDLKELNISDMRGIDTARSIIDNINYKPVEGGSKVIILNEAHQATKDFQNAMLEKLEEPPPDVYFIICTTDPQKLLTTIRSRCALRKFFVKPLKRRETQELIERVLREEEVEWKERHVVKMVKVAEGNPREALLLLDNLIDLKGSRLTRALDELMSTTVELPISLARALNNSAPWKEVAEILKGLEGGDAEDIRWMMITYMRKVLLGNPSGEKAFILECFEDSFRDSGLAGLTLACYRAVHFFED